MCEGQGLSKYEKIGNPSQRRRPTREKKVQRWNQKRVELRRAGREGGVGKRAATREEKKSFSRKTAAFKDGIATEKDSCGRL